MKKITLIYSSGGGNTALVVKKISEILEQHHIQIDLINAIVATPNDLKKTDLILIAAPTYDHGVLHAPMDRLLFAAQEIDLNTHTYAIIGLGDSKYDKEYTVEAAPILENFIINHHGTLIHTSLKINKSPVDQLDTHVTERTHSLLTKINTHENS